jgi:hypothetical protein
MSNIGNSSLVLIAVLEINDVHLIVAFFNRKVRL